MEITLMVKTEKYKVTLEEDAKVCDLQQAVAEAINADAGMQKIIFKGTTVSRFPGEFLSEYGMKNGSKLMVIPRENNIEEQRILQKMGEIETQASRTIDNVNVNLEQLDSVLKGFNETDRAVIFLDLKKNFVRLAETLMKQVETIDSITVDGEFQSAKLKRKTLVVKIQSYLDKCDASLEKIP